MLRVAVDREERSAPGSRAVLTIDALYTLTWTTLPVVLDANGRER